MSASNPDGWPSSLGPSASGPPNGGDQHSQGQQRVLGGFGTATPATHSTGPQTGGPVLPPPAAPFYPSSQQGGHSIPTLAGLAQPLPPASQGHSQNSQPAGAQAQAVPQSSSYPLPALGQSLQQGQVHANVEREREIRQIELREREARDRQRHQDDIAQREREREQQERDIRERQQRESQPHQNHTGSIPIHQPVASKVATAIHGPGGLLSGIGPGSATNPSGALAHSSIPANVFGGPLQVVDGPTRPAQQIAAQAGPHQVLSFGSGHALHPLSGGVTGLSQGQQPILNDALSYLDQVKVQFVDQPDVYNRFLDIMKDFKSQAIDTPGVIERVSTLFAGHPNLVQGFNTFLPPGYRIECGTGDDPNAIRVTTPMGTTVSSLPRGYRPSSPPSNGIPPANGVGNTASNTARQNSYYDQIPRNATNVWPQSQHGPVISEGMFSPSGRPMTMTILGPQGGQPQGMGQVSHIESQNPRDQQVAPAGNLNILSQHQQEQRGVSQLQSAATAAAAAAGPVSRQQASQGSPNSATPQLPPPPTTSLNGTGAAIVPGSQLGVEKRGPVEFNHAISYVNKIKNRFANQPEIYKQFLEILQTYQRESKPIGDVYAQVTQLFNSAPDLLEDFKQFLPETAAQAKAQAAVKQAAEDAAMLSNVRSEAAYSVAGQAVHAVNQQTPGAHRSEVKMPPVGNFAPPPSVGKDKKRRSGVGATASSTHVAGITADHSPSLPGMKSGASQGAISNKRTKLTHNKSAHPELPTLSPTLTPALPYPLPPTVAPDYTDELVFFDRVKKFLGNKQVMQEFLKLCNLFSQDLIDKAVLINKVSGFIGGSPELMNWFKRFVSYESRDEIIENRPRLPTTKVILSNCRGYGPSYRLLPRRERMKTCSGRDQMCYDVLNDEWASHPTWASEDSGFVAHRKNAFEEALHRVEEERHDYDFTIEANLRAIQLLEPIARTIDRMTDEEKAAFKLNPGIGGQSTAIYQRVIKKIYGRERGQHIINALLARPAATVPVLLARLKSKDEEWKSIQREWEKVWREQTVKNYWKSLDHMGINARAADKKQFMAKTLNSEIHTKYEEQRQHRGLSGVVMPKYQFEYFFEDNAVVLDACRLLVVFIMTATNYNGADRQKLEMFIKDFVTRFFDIPQEKFEEDMSIISTRLINDEERQETGAAFAEPASGRNRPTTTVKKTDLLRGVLDRSRVIKHVNNDSEGTGFSGSKETTPEVSSAMEEDADGTIEGSTENADTRDPNEDNWVQLPEAGRAHQAISLARDIPRNEPYGRETYSLYCSTTIYCFFRMFQILYERLLQVKKNENQVGEYIRIAKIAKPADAMQLIDKRPEDFFADTSSNANYYKQLLDLCQDVMEQQLEMAQFEEVLRHFYLHCGWQLYGFDRLLSTLARFAMGVVSNDAKEKTSDIMQLFYKDREKEETTHQAEISYRKQVEKLIKDGDVYRIEFNQRSKRATVQILKKGDATFDEDSLSAEAKWSYYVASYIKVEPTEGVQIDGHLSMPFLKRNLPEDVDEPEERKRLVPTHYENGLEMRICVNSYKILWMPKTEDWFIHLKKPDGNGHSVSVDQTRMSEKRRAKFEEKFVTRNSWIDSSPDEEVARILEEYKTWVGEGTRSATEGKAIQDVDGDNTMTES